MRSRAHLALLAVVVVWAGSFSVIKELLDHGVGALDIAVVRYAIAAPGFALILWRKGGLPGLTRLVSQAAAGEILVSSAAAEASSLEVTGLEERTLTLKGKDEMIDAVAVAV